MTPDTYARDGAHRISVGGVLLQDLAQEFGTPLYVIDVATMEHRLHKFLEALSNIPSGGRLFYAAKAFLCTAMAGWLRQFEAGIDVVSGGELYTALGAGIEPERVLFHGNVKTAAEVRYALKAGVGTIVADSMDELHLLDQEAGALGVRAPVVLRLTPGIDAHTHAFIRTGQFDSKFGFAMAQGISDRAVELALALPHVDLIGFHAHIGSQILEADPFVANAEALLQYSREWWERRRFWPRILDIGGGFGVRYQASDDPPDVREVFRRVGDLIAEMTPPAVEAPTIFIEPGRSIVGEAGVTLYRVQATKHTPEGREFAAVDGGMGDNIRPALYQARYEAAIDGKDPAGPTATVAVAGRYCESGDIIVPSVELAVPEVGDLLVTFVTGAYNYSMASNYNRVPRPAVVAVQDGGTSVWVEGESWADLVAKDRPYGGRA